ncbi:3-methyl-2-oxobutanoate hydroxymethyltransferase [Pyrenophora tritici-repentis Pt-1C-BFP]|uniref:3-methyl-2-oxobutanoate hydroxymethyltransferase n=1 Tax=Pyrenophora tritici-repentis (strain Pt-1C-BFP) TaxID=426418 RepID=B2VWR0_PYRTR|nr:3-methyl-2-oxobutanoate hydroxymethyltransferase [Pyrenophora tritici-repentis Pt-1C-BFP]EDU41060.1 3-methyl-2-oxobutanoate hydroxymethyltransferase [Pyrenophora tritici-repentis Pt-1C-BFP]
MSRALLSTLRTPLRLTNKTSRLPSLSLSPSPLLPIPTRWSSHSPLGAALTRKPVTIASLQSMYRKHEPITMITAHDFPSAHVADHAGMDMILVGDSLAMVALGMEDTSEILLEEMLLHCKSVARATKAAFTVGDLPMGSYEISPQQALTTAITMLKIGRVKAIKLEGGEQMAPTIRTITTAGIPVLAHVGLTPQRAHALSGFRVQGRTAASALQVLRDARAVQNAGAFAVVLEAVPAEVAAVVTKELRIPTIGIGAGAGCSGPGAGAGWICWGITPGEDCYSSAGGVLFFLTLFIIIYKITYETNN